jgi:23S rRNA pseudouridine1911/1915/1917 synthase
MVAKNAKAVEDLGEQLRLKTVTRKYLALVEGVIPHNLGKINAPIGRDPKNRQAMRVVEKGKVAVTNFKVLTRYENNTLIECQLETGRTHQIRVHLNYIGYPLVGDPKYGRKKTDTTHGQFLHAKTLGFIHPTTKEYMEFDSELPKYFTDHLESLG